MLRFSRMIRLHRPSLLAVAALAASSCAAPYYWQAIGGQIQLLRKREPIERVVEDPAIAPDVKVKLEAVRAIRRFAVDELGLPDNDSYKSYVALDRSYVVWNVVAADEFSVDPKRWCFPFAGCVSYRGFFDREAAERFQAKLEREGLDTYSGGSTAYSTLGYFADPVLSTMLAGGEQAVASLLFHELAHQRLYIKDDSAFSESFATAIEQYGTERWLREHATEADLERYRVRLAHREDFGELIATAQARLRQVYASDESADDKRRDKEAAFESLKSDYAARKAQWGSGDYDGWFAQRLNNATLASVATYTRWVPALRARLDAVGLTQFYADAEALADLSVDERAQRMQGWDPGAAVSASR